MEPRHVTVRARQPPPPDYLAKSYYELWAAGLETLLRIEAGLARQTSVMCGHDIRAKPLGQMHRQPLAQPACVHEHQRRSMLLNKRGDPVVDLVPELVGRDRSQLASRHFDGEIERATRRDLDDDRIGPARAREKARDQLDGFLRRLQADARDGRPGQRVEPFE